MAQWCLIMGHNDPINFSPPWQAYLGTYCLGEEGLLKLICCFFVLCGSHLAIPPAPSPCPSAASALAASSKTFQGTLCFLATPYPHFLCTLIPAGQVKKTMEATLQTIQDIVTIEDFDVSDCFQYSNSMESVKSTVSETFMSKPSIAKRRANQQETEQFYFTVRS